jgi:tRNA threonylcarbamoyladenosine biosynthesis protein TsaB
MYTLALDTSAQGASVALFKDGNLISEVWHQYDRTHSEHFMTMIEGVLSSHKLTVSQVDDIVVLNGPGSYTGLRIALATAKGLSQPYGIPIYPVSTLDVLGYQQKPYVGYVLAIMDARNNQIYGGGYELTQNQMTEVIPKGAYEINDFIKAIPGCSEILLCGDGAKVYYEQISAVFDGNILMAQTDRLTQRASSGAIFVKSLVEDNLSVDCHHLKADYLRQSQAERLKK